MTLRSSHWGALAAGLFACALGAGCSDGIDVNSKLLDYVGSAVNPARQEPTLADRPGLVIPPPMAALPEPGSGTAVAAAVNAQLPQGPEAQAAAAAAAKKQQEAEACQKAEQDKKNHELQAACPGLATKLWNSGIVSIGQ